MWAAIQGEGGLVNTPAFAVGAVFIATISTNPFTLLGYGVWEAFATGQFLVGIDAADPSFRPGGHTGGAKTAVPAGTVSTPTLTMASYTPTGNVTISSFVGNGTVNPASAGTPTGNVSDPTLAMNSYTPAGTITLSGSGNVTSGGAESALFAGTPATLTGTISTPVFTGDVMGNHTHTLTISGNVTGATFAGDAHVLTGTISDPVFTGSALGILPPYVVVYMWTRVS